MKRTRPCAFIVTDAFPPVSAVGVHRVIALCKRLVADGWEVEVITPRPQDSDGQDATMLADIPSGVTIHATAMWDLAAGLNRLLRRRRSAGPPASGQADANASASSAPVAASTKSRWRRMVDWLSWWLFVPDKKAGWFLPAVVAGLTAGCRPDVIFSTAPVWTCLLVGRALSCLLRVPHVADFRDPWFGSKFIRLPAAHQRLIARMERSVVAHAAKITCAWKGIERLLAERYPARAGDITTILNGFDPERIDSAEPIRPDARRCVLLHSGTVYGPRSPVPLLEGLASLKQRRPEAADQLAMVFLGVTTYNGQSLEELARRHDVADCVRVLPPASHGEAMGLLKGADVAVLLGQCGKDELASIPAKAYEYIGAGKNVLAIGAGEEVIDVMARGGCRIWQVAADSQAIAAAMEEILAASPGSGPTETAMASRMEFTRSRTAEALASVMSSAKREG